MRLETLRLSEKTLQNLRLQMAFENDSYGSRNNRNNRKMRYGVKKFTKIMWIESLQNRSKIFACYIPDNEFISRIYKENEITKHQIVQSMKAQGNEQIVLRRWTIDRK